MLQCREAGSQVRLSRSENPTRKLPYTWELYHNGKVWIVVNTQRANQLAEEALRNEAVVRLSGLSGITPEVPYRARVSSGHKPSATAERPHPAAKESRADFRAVERSGRTVWIEVKSVSLVDERGRFAFPDAVTERGQRHLDELRAVVKRGERGVLWFILMRNDGRGFCPARHIDPVYSRKLVEALWDGVEILINRCHIDETRLTVSEEEPFDPDSWYD